MDPITGTAVAIGAAVAAFNGTELVGKKIQSLIGKSETPSSIGRDSKAMRALNAARI